MTLPPHDGRHPLTLGFIGGSLQSAVGYAHLVAMRMDGQWRVEAGCFSTDDSDNRATAAAYGVPTDRNYESWKEMVAAEARRLDAVLILTPTPDHAEIVLACLDAGLAVICEKALATNAAEVREILARVHANKSFLAVTYNYSGYPMLRELRHLITTGRLGRILHFQAEMPQEGFIRTDTQGNAIAPQAWRLTDRDVPTIYLDLGVHLHQLLHYLLGADPLAVVALQATGGSFPQVIDNVSCLCKYTDGIQGQLWFSKSALGHRNGLRLRIFGSDGAAEWYQADPEALVLAQPDGRREIVDRGSPVDIASAQRYARFKVGHPAGFLEAFANLYVDIADALRAFQAGERAASSEVFGADLALQGHMFLESMARSISRESWQKVE